jgi:holo-[acyl-carrier protein] synthase
MNFGTRHQPKHSLNYSYFQKGFSVFQIQIGNDLVYLPKFKHLLQKDSFIQKVFHPIEVEYCEKKIDKLSSYAARFAAKEAFSKALGTGLYVNTITPKDIWIENLPSGKPTLFFSEKMQEILKNYSIQSLDVSLTHHGDYAMSHVVLILK